MATGLTISSSSTMASGQKILVANAKLAFEPAAPDPDLVSNERIPQGHKQWDILTYARLSAASELTEGVDLAQSQQLVTAATSITPTEHGIIVTLSKSLRRRQGDSNVVSVAGQQMGSSMRRQMATNVIALYDGFSKSVVDAGNTLDITHFRGSVAYLLTDNDSAYGPAPLPLHAALHIEQISDIILDISDPGAVVSSRFGMSAEMLQRWWKGSDRLYGVQVYHSGVISRDSSGDSKGAIFAKEALHLVMTNEAETAEQQADISLRADEFGLFQEWGEAERADPHGVEVYSDTTATV
jgi:hypothetical protein